MSCFIRNERSPIRLAQKERSRLSWVARRVQHNETGRPAQKCVSNILKRTVRFPF
jgi:hypothetical protein